jgi:hypothetical protein
MNRPRMSTTVPKTTPCAIEVCNVGIRHTLNCAAKAQCQGCPKKKLCTPGLYRRLSVNWHEPARQAVRALAGTPAYERSRRARYRIETLFAELKQRMRLARVRLRRLWNVGEQFLMAAPAQNIKRLVRFLAQSPPIPRPVPMLVYPNFKGMSWRPERGGAEPPFVFWQQKQKMARLRSP